jgi:hypothetical protein
LSLKTDKQDIESCDVRLTTITYDEENKETITLTDWMDVLFYRFGYFKYQKMNLIDMVKKFDVNKEDNNGYYDVSDDVG